MMAREAMKNKALPYLLLIIGIGMGYLIPAIPVQATPTQPTPIVFTATEEIIHAISTTAIPIRPTGTASPTATNTSTPTQTPTQCVRTESWIWNTIRAGDSLSQLAELSNSTVNDIKFNNCLTDDLILEGGKILLPIKIKITSTLTATATMSMNTTPLPTTMVSPTLTPLPSPTTTMENPTASITPFPSPTTPAP